MGRTLEIEARLAQLSIRLYRNPHGLGLSSVEGHEFELHQFWDRPRGSFMQFLRLRKLTTENAWASNFSGAGAG